MYTKEPAEAQSDKNGLNDFEAYMQQLSYAPAAELANVEENHTEEKTAIEQSQAHQKTTPR